MGHRINRPDFLKLNGFTFSFNMTDHLNPLIPEDASLTAICEKISKYHMSTFPKWTRLKANFRIVRITPEKELFQYLDETSQTKVFNWLIFSRVGSRRIIVTHFGPFGKTKDEDFDDKVNQTRRSLRKLKDIWLQVHSSSQPEREKQAQINAIHRKILSEYWSVIKAIEERIEAKKKELEKIAGTVFTDKERKERIEKEIARMTIKAGMAVVRRLLRALVIEITVEITKMIAKFAAKQSAKQGAKGASKGAAKTTTKSVPVLGLAVGTGFALWRLAEGDVVGAGLEVVSGAASCVPGAGTAASVAIDTGLLVNDVKNAVVMAKEQINKLEVLKADTKRIERELQELFEECEKAKEEYDYIGEVLGDQGYDFRKLIHDINLVDDVLDDLC